MRSGASEIEKSRGSEREVKTKQQLKKTEFVGCQCQLGEGGVESWNFDVAERTGYELESSERSRVAVRSLSVTKSMERL